ncbi:MAG: acetyl-CoA carboxylase carboxyltransferase subunit alpha [Oscillospiraceae bacterium]|jgi:acetyl-CoA carboxylase carboxyl transferase subunit alpha|nr:acetyl-CoA carboxylase carboxyltransferase subunit alpha [Oscillospiraceae bacterium]
MSKLSAYEKLLLIRNKDRPIAKDYIEEIFDEFTEMHGDRLFGDDNAIITGIGRLNNRPVTVIAETRGHNLNDNKRTNFGMPHPEGYRKALRAAKQAEKFHRPVICFIDTPGAFCGIDAENRGQGEAIAKNIAEFMTLKTPVVSVVIGEGGSGGALALGVCDVLLMLENSLYSVISPRGFASILWKDPSKEKEACEILKITAEDMLNFGISDGIIPEVPMGIDLYAISENIKETLTEKINEISEKPIDELLNSRYTKFRSIGSFEFN